MARLGKCPKCKIGELSLSVVCEWNNPRCFCKNCFEDFPISMKGISRNYTLDKEELEKEQQRRNNF